MNSSNAKIKVFLKKKVSTKYLATPLNFKNVDFSLYKGTYNFFSYFRALPICILENGQICSHMNFIIRETFAFFIGVGYGSTNLDL